MKNKIAQQENQLANLGEEKMLAIADYKEQLTAYNNLVTEYNTMTDNLTNTVSFVIMQAGILYTAITGAVPLDPLMEISPLMQKIDGTDDLQYMRNGFLVFIKTLQKESSGVAAMAAWRSFTENQSLT